MSSLADWWENYTGKPFKQSWYENKPLTDAAMFVHDVIEFVAPERLHQLPKVTKKLVAAWRKGRRDEWWRDAPVTW